MQYGVRSPKEGDVLTFDGNEWKAVPHASAFGAEQQRIYELQSEIKALAARIRTLEEHINKIAKATKETI